MISMYEKAAWILYKMSPMYFTEDTEEHQAELSIFIFHFEVIFPLKVIKILIQTALLLLLLCRILKYDKSVYLIHPQELYEHLSS